MYYEFIILLNLRGERNLHIYGVLLLLVSLITRKCNQKKKIPNWGNGLSSTNWAQKRGLIDNERDSWPQKESQL